MKTRRGTLWALAAIVAAGALLRLGAALPGLLDDPARRFVRPDTAGYFAVAGYFLGIDSAENTVCRAPGFPALTAAVVGVTGSMTALTLLLTLIGAATTAAVFAAALFFTRSDPAALIAAALYAFNLTAIANAPMWLSDTLFGLLAALQLLAFARFYRDGTVREFLLCCAIAAAGALVRPINQPWILVLLVLLAAAPRVDWRCKIWLGVLGLGLFAAILLPWQWRNAHAGAGWVIDTNTGAMYHQNGAMLLAAVKRTTYESEKQRILAEQKREFADIRRYPDEKSREAYRMSRFAELVRRYPLTLLTQHLNWHILLPDAPTAGEILGVTTSDRGTMNVLAAHGVAAAVRHYFAGRVWFVAALLPLLGITALLYGGAAAAVVALLVNIRRRWYELLIVLGFVEYYLFLPGAISAPRYQLPALPLLAVMAAAAFTALTGRLWKKTASGGIAVQFREFQSVNGKEDGAMNKKISGFRRNCVSGSTLFEAAAALCVLFFVFAALFQIYQWCVGKMFCQYSSFYASKGMTLGYKLNLVRRGARVAAIAVSGESTGATSGSELTDAQNYMTGGDSSGVCYSYWYPQRSDEPELYVYGNYEGDGIATRVKLRNSPLIRDELAKVLGIADTPEPSAETRNYNYSKIYLEE